MFSWESETEFEVVVEVHDHKTKKSPDDMWVKTFKTSNRGFVKSSLFGLVWLNDSKRQVLILMFVPRDWFCATFVWWDILQSRWVNVCKTSKWKSNLSTKIGRCFVWSIVKLDCCLESRSVAQMPRFNGYLTWLAFHDCASTSSHSARWVNDSSNRAKTIKKSFMSGLCPRNDWRFVQKQCQYNDARCCW